MCLYVGLLVLSDSLSFCSFFFFRTCSVFLCFSICLAVSCSVFLWFSICLAVSVLIFLSRSLALSFSLSLFLFYFPPVSVLHSFFSLFVTQSVRLLFSISFAYSVILFRVGTLFLFLSQHFSHSFSLALSLPARVCMCARSLWRCCSLSHSPTYLDDNAMPTSNILLSLHFLANDLQRGGQGRWWILMISLSMKVCLSLALPVILSLSLWKALLSHGCSSLDACYVCLNN